MGACPQVELVQSCRLVEVVEVVEVLNLQRILPNRPVFLAVDHQVSLSRQLTLHSQPTKPVQAVVLHLVEMPSQTLPRYLS
jgi:hypothetical protein